MLRSVVAVAGLAALLALRYWPAVSAAEPLPDEKAYVAAGRLVARGLSPYDEPAYLSPPVVGYALAAGERWLGVSGARGAFRLAHLLGGATLLWLGVAPLALRPALRWLLAAALGCVLPGFVQGLTFGNLTLASGGLLLGGLAAWTSFPLLAGALLGISIAVKPIAPLAVVALAAHRPVEGGRRHLVAAAVSAGTAAALLLAVPGWRELLAPHPALSSRSASWHRLAYLAGFEVPPLFGLVAVALLTVALVRPRPLRRAELAAVAVTAALAATPLVWNHTLLLALPVQALALRTLAARRRRGEAGGAESLLVSLVALVPCFAEGATGIDDRAVWIQVLAVLPPATAPLLLCLYATRAGEPRPPVL
jgi:hypothetical protein